MLRTFDADVWETSLVTSKPTMAPNRIYPRSSIKKIFKAHSNRSISKKAEILVSHLSLVTYPGLTFISWEKEERRLMVKLQIFLDYTLFVQE